MQPPSAQPWLHSTMQGFLTISPSLCTCRIRLKAHPARQPKRLCAPKKSHSWPGHRPRARFCFVTTLLRVHTFSVNTPHTLSESHQHGLKTHDLIHEQEANLEERFASKQPSMKPPRPQATLPRATVAADTVLLASQAAPKKKSAAAIKDSSLHSKKPQASVANVTTSLSLPKNSALVSKTPPVAAAAPLRRINVAPRVAASQEVNKKERLQTATAVNAASSSGTPILVRQRPRSEQEESPGLQLSAQEGYGKSMMDFNMDGALSHKEDLGLGKRGRSLDMDSVGQAAAENGSLSSYQTDEGR